MVASVTAEASPAITWLTTAVQRRIREVLTRDMSNTTIRTCRIAWALDAGKHSSDPEDEIQGIRSIISASGVSDRIVKSLLPPEGDQDPLGLITCIDKGRAGLDRLTIRRSHYEAIGKGSTPTQTGPITCASNSMKSSRSVAFDQVDTSRPSLDGSVKEVGTPLDGAVSCAVRHQVLHPGHDVFTSKNMGDLGWALAVVHGPVDIGDEPGTEVTLADLRRLTGKTQQGVYAVLAGWTTAPNTVPFHKEASPGLPTRLHIMFSQLLKDDYHQRNERRVKTQARHENEAALHRQRQTWAGKAAWVLATGREWMWGGRPPMVPADTLLKGEQAIYEYLVAVKKKVVKLKDRIKARLKPVPTTAEDKDESARRAVLIALLRGDDTPSVPRHPLTV